MQIRAKKISETFYLKNSEHFKIGSIIGIDEAGRGAWAGPVVAGACIFLDEKIRTNSHFANLGDSKKISEKGRKILFEILTEWKKLGWIDFEVGASTSEEIDTIGIKNANNLAMQRAIDGLLLRKSVWKKKNKSLFICIDGNDHYTLNIGDFCKKGALEGNVSKTHGTRNESFEEKDHILINPILELIKGDAIIKEISVASIIAKVTRDTILIELGKKYPQYGFEKHKGYGTKIHQIAITRCNVLSFHRKSFAPIKKFTQSS